MSNDWEFGEAAAPQPAVPDRFPWPPMEGGAGLTAFGETWKRATFEPAAFFRGMPRRAAMGPALLYYLIIVVLVAGASLFWDSLSLFAGQFEDTAMAAELGVDSVSPLVGFLLTPAILLALLYLSAGVIHLLLTVLGAARHGFGTTVRVICYAYSPGLFGIVPILGGLVGSVWMLVLLIIGLREAHETEGWKAAVAVLLPFAIAMGFMILAFLFLVAASAAIMGGMG
jgi:hypothetical protein